jgi:Icc-related predicted phosphoesterase
VRLLVFSDIHGDRRALEKLMATEADHYFDAGDLSTWGRGLDEMGPILQAHGERVHILPGNHESLADTQRLCVQYGLDSFHERTLQLDGYTVAGLGYSNPTPFKTPGEYSEEELAERLAKFASFDPLVLICHAPPFGTALDEIRHGLHAGSTAVREFIDKHQPRWFFCGHIHEAGGRAIEMGTTRAMNVGRRGYLLEL